MSCLESLASVLRHEIDLHEALFAAAEEKRLAIIAGDLSRMEQLLVEEHQVIDQVRVAEEKRQGLTLTACEELGLPVRGTRLAAIAEVAPAPHGETLRGIHNTLRELIDRLRYRNRQNAELLSASLSHVDAFMQAVGEACQEPAGYGRDAQVKATRMHSMLDRSA